MKKAPLIIGVASLAFAGVSIVMAKKVKAAPREKSLTGLQTGYFHLESLAVREGQFVKRGEFLGLMGADPNGGPRHLHFELMPFPFPNGQYSRHSTIDPESWLEQGILAWPVERYQGRLPTISSSHFRRNPDRDHPGEDEDHAGVDVMFERLPTDTQIVGPGEGAKRFVAYRGSRVLAAASGVVVQADWTKTGNRIWVRHT